MKNVEFRAVLAITIVVCAFLFLFAMLFHKVPSENEALINVVSGAILVGGVGAIIGYYFGSAKGHPNEPPTNVNVVNEPQSPIPVETVTTEDTQQ